MSKESVYKISEERKEELKEKFKDISFVDILEFWLITYPEDVFVKEPKKVVKIRKIMKEILIQGKLPLAFARGFSQR